MQVNETTKENIKKRLQPKCEQIAVQRFNIDLPSLRTHEDLLFVFYFSLFLFLPLSFSMSQYFSLSPSLQLSSSLLQTKERTKQLQSLYIYQIDQM